MLSPPFEEYIVLMPETHYPEAEVNAQPVALSHVVRTIKAYRWAILLSLGAVAIGYMILAIWIYLMSPTQRITTQSFRLEFEGATQGRYPNGIRFSTSEIISTPNLLRIYNANDLKRFVRFDDFSRSLYVLEANVEYDRAAADFQARLADPKISPIDRERIQREWEAKVAALSKNDYSLNFLRTRATQNIPEALVQKVLKDLLTEWASYAIREQHVLRYRLGVLSPDILNESGAPENDYIISLQVLRSKVNRIIGNIDELLQVPGAELVRTETDHSSLGEMRLRLEEVLRFRVEPLVGAVRANGLIANPAATTRYLEAQLAYDQRALKYNQDLADSIQKAIVVYTDARSIDRDKSSTTASNANGAAPKTGAQSSGGSETLMPQLSDSFIDRLVALTNQTNDVQYRQTLVEQYRKSQAALAPLESAVAYDQEILALVKNTPAGSAQNADVVKREIATTEAQVRQVVTRVNEVYEIVSRNLNPSKELFSLIGSPITRTERSSSLPRLMMFGILVMLVSLPVIVVLCLLHNRVREEEQSEAYDRV